MYDRLKQKKTKNEANPHLEKDGNPFVRTMYEVLQLNLGTKFVLRCRAAEKSESVRKKSR